MSKSNGAEPVDDEDDRFLDEDEPVMEKLEQLGGNVAQFIADRPLAAVGVAVAVGFVLGRLIQR